MLSRFFIEELRRWRYTVRAHTRNYRLDDYDVGLAVEAVKDR